jgi:hypothetical protein
MSQQQAEGTMAATMADAVTEEEVVEAVCHCERTGPLATGGEEWHRPDSLAALPERPLDGWEELVVFTDEHVYRQVGVGYDGGVSVTPRTPAAVVTAADAGTPTAAAADDD